MFEHHKQSIDNLLDYFKNDEEIISIILGGSVAKGCERADSDIDAIIVVSPQKFSYLESINKLSECILGYCTYENGYFDIKYCTEEYLHELADNGSEPCRNAFLSSKCLLTNNPQIHQIIAKIPVFQKHQKEDKMLSFYSALELNSGYFWDSSKNNRYLRTRTVADIVLFGLRLILQVNEVLFPCHKALMQTVSQLANKPENIVEKADRLLSDPTDDIKNDFVHSVLEYIRYTPPEDYSKVLTRFIDDNELWWYKHRPVITEW